MEARTEKFLLSCGLGLALLFFHSPAEAQNYGLETRQSIGPFLNYKLPSLPPGTPGGWVVAKAFPNLTFYDPISVRPEPNSDRLYVCCRQGIIEFFENNPDTSTKTVFLDIRNQTQGWDDCGLLGLAFHPEFRQPDSPNRGYVYVYYNYSPNPTSGPSRPAAATPGFTRLSRFTVPDGSMVADPSSELVLINQYDRHLWHNGGAMFFGDDGFLYLTVGDEGGANDEYLSAQTLSGGLFSGVLRLDVNMDPAKSHPIRHQPRSGGNNSPVSATDHYFIPNDNPFLDPSGNTLEEFWAVGLRSPHSMTIDPVTKRIWVGDVGQNKWEEINIMERAGNYQWPYREGLIDGPKSKPNPMVGNDKPPLYTYLHDSGNNCVIGGYVYRGNEHADVLSGKYIFGDNVSGRIWTISYDGTNPPEVNELCDMPTGSSGYSGLSGFGTDRNGELLLCKMGEQGTLYKLQRINPSPQPPALLSETGAFTNLATLSPAPGIIPYAVNSPLWSDGAKKQRWIAVPDGQRIKFFPTNEWDFPEGTVFIKQFELPLDEKNPTVMHRLETRFIVRSGENVYGVTYKWRADQSDADLLPDGLSDELSIKTKKGTRKQTWSYPRRSECLFCHTANAKFVLGVKTHQLNGNFNYSGHTDNQLRTWNHLGLFDPEINESDIASLPKTVAVDDKSAPVENRIRSYLDANCSFCHRPSGVNAYFDARFNTPLDSQGIIDGPLANPLDLKNGKVISPANLDHSVMYLRVKSESETKMPPIARSVVDAAAMAALSEWITGMSAGKSPLTFSVTGNGTVAPNLSGQTLEIGKTYRLKAWAGKGQLFAGWSGDVSSLEPVLNFTMQSNLVVTANFIPNPFVQWQGTYNGLFYEDEMVRHESSGALMLKLSLRGTFSGKIMLSGKRSSLSGHFDASGQVESNIKKSRSGIALTVNLQLDPTFQTDQVVGQIENNNWSAAMRGDRAILKNRTNDLSGQYTLVFPGKDSDAAIRSGTGFASAKIDSSGRIRMTGYLSDNTRISQSAVLSKNGQWPLYIPLYKGKGSMLSWINIGNGSNILENSFSWIRVADAAAKIYPTGFTNQTSLVGSKYFSPPKGGHVLDLTNSVLILSGGNLITNLTSDVSISGNNINGEIPGLKLSIQPAQGLINGRFLHPATQKSVAIKGVILQEQKSVQGYFMGNTESGAVMVK